MKRFIDEEISVEIDREFFLKKDPPCPDRLVWRDQVIPLRALLRSWDDFSRKGRMAKNMRASHRVRAQNKGSWGVGRRYFECSGAQDAIYCFYYDRAPKDAGDKLGCWILVSIEDGRQKQ